MAYVTLLQNNFMSGEVSPKLEGRIDLPRYQTGLRTCENFLPMRHGGLRKRPGSMYKARTKGDQPARLLPFSAMDGTPYVFELSARNLRIYTSAGVQYGADLVLPYASISEIRAMKWAVNKGVMWLIHPAYSPVTVTLSGGSFAVTTPSFTGSRTFAAAGDYPSIVFFHQGRLGLAGSLNRPSEVCLSRAPDAAAGSTRYLDFTVGTSPSDAIVIEKSDQGPVNLCWAVSHLRLVLASRRLVAMDNGQVATPSTFDFQTCVRGRPLDIQGALSQQMVLYLAAGPSLHGAYYSNDSSGYVDVDLTRDSDHILLPGVVDLAVQNSPETIAWIARTDGKLVSVTLDPANGVVAPALHSLGGLVESVCITDSDAGDILWLVINRDSRRAIETVSLPDLGALPIADEHYVDGGIIYSGAATKTISGLVHLEGASVVTLGDGTIRAAKTVAEGTITLDAAATKAHVGIPISSKLETLRPEVPAQGTSQGKKKRIEELTLRLYRTLGGKVAAAGKSESPLLYITAGDYKYGDPIALFTGDKKKTIAGGLDSDTTLVVTHSEPTPCNILALIYRVAIMEP